MPTAKLLDRPDASRLRANDSQAARANAEAGLGRRRGRARKPGQALWEVVEYLREHGETPQTEVRRRVGIHETAMPTVAAQLVERGAIETGEFVKRSPVLRLGPNADDVKPPKGMKDARRPAGDSADGRLDAAAGERPPAAATTSQGSTEPGARYRCRPGRDYSARITGRSERDS